MFINGAFVPLNHLDFIRRVLDAPVRRPQGSKGSPKFVVLSEPLSGKGPGGYRSGTRADFLPLSVEEMVGLARVLRPLYLRSGRLLEVVPSDFDPNVPMSLLERLEELSLVLHRLVPLVRALDREVHAARRAASTDSGISDVPPVLGIF